MLYIWDRAGLMALVHAGTAQTGLTLVKIVVLLDFHNPSERTPYIYT